MPRNLSSEDGNPNCCESDEIMRLCPVCTVEFTPLLLSNETIIDYCKSCKGVWFDGKELEGVRREEQVLQTILANTVLHPAPFRCKNCSSLNPRMTKTCAACGKELKLDCPNCARNLDEVQIGTLVVDRCRKCKGVWLDGGELTALFVEFQKVRALQKTDRPKIAIGDAAGTIGDITLTTLIWAPDLVFYSAAAIGEIASKLPGAAIEIASNMPELAGKAVEVSGNLISGAIDLAGHAPEAAAGLADLFSSFLEAILGLFND